MSVMVATSDVCLPSVHTPASTFVATYGKPIIQRISLFAISISSCFTAVWLGPQMTRLEYKPLGRGREQPTANQVLP